MADSSKETIHVGQILCGGFSGTSVSPQARYLITKLHVSMMILSRKNFESVKQMGKLIRELQYIAFHEAKYKYPIMFAVDQEGGMMNALFDADSITQIPGAMGLAATQDEELVYEVSKALALELKHLGFSIMFGPVLDVVTKFSHQLVGVRSFGTTIEEVTRYGKATARGFKDGGLCTFGKHFPGIGNASVDSLLELPMMGESLDQIRHFNSVPFADLIHAGYLDGISAAGCGVPTISPDETHACLSPPVVTQLLREEIGFDGVVISECLEMDALYHSIGLGQGVILAITAGCDLVLVCHDLELQIEAHDSLKKAIENGNLDDEVVNNCLRRIETLQHKLPGWNEVFPSSSKPSSSDIVLFKEKYPDLWQTHQRLSESAYQHSITLIRGSNAIPIQKYIANASKEPDNILLMTPLLSPIYPASADGEKSLYNGEQVFQKFGELLANHPSNTNNVYNVLHTTYTANGLTSFHESLIEKARMVIILTSEASRNMYQIGIVKYVSVLCGAKPNSLGNSGAPFSQLSKPLYIIATSSPYDFFYNKNIGSAFLCCYDYTDNALTQLTKVLMGDVEAVGSIPGEKKHMSRHKKRKILEDKSQGNSAPKRRWLVDEFDLTRDWTGLVNLLRSNANATDGPVSGTNFSNEEVLKKLYTLFSTSKEQKHFVIRNSSLNILYGITVTWVEKTIPFDGDLSQEKKVGSIVFILTDRSKRLQSIGKNLSARAIRYLVKEQECTKYTVGGSFPILALFPYSEFTQQNKRLFSFVDAMGWGAKAVNTTYSQIMRLSNIQNWQVPKKIFKELTIVGIRFDICTEASKLTTLLDRMSKSEQSLEKVSWISGLYSEAIKAISSGASQGVKIIIALEPANQNVIGSIILFTKKSPLAKFFPFIAQSSENESLVSSLVGPVIDPSYSNLTEIFKYGLICSGITLLKSSFNENGSSINSCLMVGASNDNFVEGVKEIGFKEWMYYLDTVSLTRDENDVF